MWRSYLESTRLLLRALDRQLSADAGISLSDFEVLALLSEAPQRRLRMSELADSVATTRSGITRAVARLVGLGWVQRAECTEDKRGSYAELTDAGLQKVRAAAPGMWRRCARTCSICSALATWSCSATPTDRSATTWPTSPDRRG